MKEEQTTAILGQLTARVAYPTWTITQVENGFIVTNHTNGKQWIFDNLKLLRENLPEIIGETAKRKEQRHT